MAGEKETQTQVAEKVEDSTIGELTFHGEEEEVESPVAEVEEVVAGEAVEEETLQKEIVQPPAAKVPATQTIPSERASDSAAFEKLIQEQQALIQQRGVELLRLQDDEEDRSLQASWERQGFGEEQIQAGLQNRREIRQTQRTLQQRQQALEEAYRGKELGLQAKVVFATKMAEGYGVPILEILKWSQEPNQDNPYILEARAKAYKAEQELAKMKQAKVKPTRMTSTGPGQVATTNRERLRDLYIQGKPLTDEQERILFGRT